MAADPEISASRANERLRFLVSQERPPGTPHASIGALLRLADDTRAGRNVMPALIVATRAGTTARHPGAPPAADTIARWEGVAREHA